MICGVNLDRWVDIKNDRKCVTCTVYLEFILQDLGQLRGVNWASSTARRHNDLTNDVSLKPVANEANDL